MKTSMGDPTLAHGVISLQLCTLLLGQVKISRNADTHGALPPFQSLMSATSRSYDTEEDSRLCF